MITQIFFSYYSASQYNNMQTDFTLELFIRLRIVQHTEYIFCTECNSSTRPTVVGSLEIECVLGSNEPSQNINKRKNTYRKSQTNENCSNEIDRETDDDRSFKWCQVRKREKREWMLQTQSANALASPIATMKIVSRHDYRVSISTLSINCGRYLYRRRDGSEKTDRERNRDGSENVSHANDQNEQRVSSQP